MIWLKRTNISTAAFIHQTSNHKIKDHQVSAQPLHDIDTTLNNIQYLLKRMLSPSLSYKLMCTTLRRAPQQRRAFNSTSILKIRGRSANIIKNNNNSANAPAVQTTSSDGVVATPINFDINSRVEGNESQIVTVALEPGQVLRAESGAMMYMTQGVEMNTTSGGGLSAGFKRMLTGQNVFISDYSYTGEEGTRGVVALGTDFPSKIVRLNVDEYGGKIVCQQGALLCASHTIDIEMEFTKKFSTGFFGGEGFVLQALTGSGDVFVKAGGTLIKRELGDGEELRISSGCLVAFTDGVDYGKYHISLMKMRYTVRVL